jgi:hypothetical protein
MPASAEVELLPCPFCGGEARYLPWKAGFYCERVICDSCDFHLDGEPAKWNTRALSAPAARQPEPHTWEDGPCPCWGDDATCKHIDGVPECQRASAQPDAQQEPDVAGVLGPLPPPVLSIQLDDDQVKELYAFMAVLGDEREFSPLTIHVGEGHSGTGLYISFSEYPEEGATFIAPLQPDAQIKAAQRSAEIPMSRLGGDAQGNSSAAVHSDCAAPRPSQAQEPPIARILQSFAKNRCYGCGWPFTEKGCHPFDCGYRPQNDDGWRQRVKEMADLLAVPAAGQMELEEAAKVCEERAAELLAESQGQYSRGLMSVAHDLRQQHNACKDDARAIRELAARSRSRPT